MEKKMKSSVATVWKQLTKLAKENGSINVAVKKIKKITGLGESTIREATKDLATEGIIKKIHKFVPDRRTGKRKQVQNEYVIVTPFSSAHSGGGRGSRSGGQKILSFKTLKELKNKKEEEAQAPAVSLSLSTPTKSQTIQTEPTQSHQTKPAAPITTTEVMAALGSTIEHYAPAVVKKVLRRFEYHFSRGWIKLPLQWVKAVLVTEQKIFEHTAKMPARRSNVTPAQNTYSKPNKKISNRPVVQIMDDGPDTSLPSEEIDRIRDMGREYEKDRHRAV
jgi:DNA-binding Lrp family transcriptional regulator